MEALARHIEQIVRPIRANSWRKNKMREELLGHLMEGVRGAIEDGANEDEACAMAVERLGDIVALRRELQASVPAIERVVFAPLPGLVIADAWMDRREGESAARFVLTRTAYTQAFLLVVLGAFALLGTLAGHPPVKAARLECALVLGALFGTQMIATALAYWLADSVGLRKVLARQGDYSAWAKGAAQAAFIMGYLALLTPPCLFVASRLGSGPDPWLALKHAATGELRWIAPLLVVALFAAFPFLGWALRKEHEHYAKWGKYSLGGRVDDNHSDVTVGAPHIP